MSTTTYQRLTGSWNLATAATACRDQLFVIDDTILFKVDPRTGDYAALTNRWHSRFLVGHRSTIYAFEADGTMYTASPEDGSWELQHETWRGVAGATAMRDELCIACDRTIYRFDPVTKACVEIPGRWDPIHMLGLGVMLFVWERDGALYRVDTRTGVATLLPGNWPLTTAVAAARDAVYAVDNGTLYSVDPRTASYTAIGDGFRSQHLIGIGSHLCSIEDGALYRLSF